MVEKEFMTVNEIADVLGLNKQTVYRMLGTVGPKYAKLGRAVLVRKTDFEEWIEKNTKGGEVK